MRLVVVVLPWAPATAMPWRNRMSSASICARGTTGRCRRLASSTSGLSSPIAADTTTASARATWARSWPTSTRTPNERSRAVIAPAATSEPVTSKPRVWSTSAMPPMPAPPMPTKCTRRTRRMPE